MFKHQHKEVQSESLNSYNSYNSSRLVLLVIRAIIISWFDHLAIERLPWFHCHSFQDLSLGGGDVPAPRPCLHAEELVWRSSSKAWAEARSEPTTEAEWSPSHVPFVEGDGFPSGSAPSAQWGEGRADKVIYLHLSTSCNGWHFHLSLKLHHLAAAPPPLLLPHKIKRGVGEGGKLDQTSWTIGKENRRSR